MLFPVAFFFSLPSIYKPLRELHFISAERFRGTNVQVTPAAGGEGRGPRIYSPKGRRWASGCVTMCDSQCRQLLGANSPSLKKPDCGHLSFSFALKDKPSQEGMGGGDVCVWRD